MQEFAAEMERLDDCEMILAYVYAFASQRGVTAFSYHCFPPFETANSKNTYVHAMGFSLRWQSAYIGERLILSDPIPDLTFANPPILTWEKAMTLSEGDPVATQFFTRLRQEGLENGVSFSLYGPKARYGYASMIFDKATQDLPGGLIALLHGVMQSAHLRIAQITAAKEEKTSDLSERELEVLRWMAQGKSASDIATILAISPDTVKTYVKRLYEKLQVGDRVAAAVKGLRLGLIDF